MLAIQLPSDGWTTARSSRPSRQATRLAWPRPTTSKPVADHQRADRHQRAARGGSAFCLTRQGKAVAVGHVVSATLPDAHTATADAHAHADGNTDTDRDRDTDGHRHADTDRHAAVLAFARYTAGLLCFLLPSYFVLVSDDVVLPELHAGPNYG